MQLNYYTIGEPALVASTTPIVLMHGILGSNHNLRPLARLLAQTHLCHLVDLPNHGLSSRLNDCSTASFVDSVVDWMQSIGIKKAHLLGHSFGGKVAMRMAVDFPETIVSLIALDIAPKTYSQSVDFDAIFAALRAVDEAQVTSRKQAQEVIAQYVASERVQQFLLSSLRKHGERYTFAFHYRALEAGREQWCRTPLTQHSLYERKTLFLCGAASDFVNQDDYTIIKQHFPYAHIQSISNAGHWLHADNLNETYQAINHFLSSVTA